MFRFSPKKESDVVLVLDIGSGSVGGALALMSENHPPTILYHFRSDIPFQERATGARLLNLCIRALNQVILAVTHEGFELAGMGAKRQKIKEVVVALSAPWIISRTFVLTLQNKEPTRITAKVFAELLRHSEEESERLDTPVPKDSVRIEQKLMKSILNGYPTSYPYEKKANEAEFAVYESFSLADITEKISDTITANIHVGHIGFHSFSLLASAVFSELYPEEENFITIDVSGEQTELSLAKKSVLMETATFPFGRNHFIRSLLRKVGTPASGVPAILKLFTEKRGSGRLFERAKTVIETTQNEWREDFSKSFSQISEELLLPRCIFLIADEDISLVLKDAISNGNWNGSATTLTAVRVITVENELLSPLVTYGSNGTKDPFLGIIMASYARLRKE